MTTIHETDIIEFLKSYEGEKFHAVLSDPPYGLAFMGKAWDKYTPKEYQAWVTEWANLLIDHLHDGAVCMFFGGTRTYHRLATGLEDAGFEIFDSMLWVYGSGFPKSHNISKAIDKSMGLEREIVGVAKGARNGNNQNIDYGDYASAVDGNYNLTKPNHQLAQQWNGYGTALKPAYEPIVLCRKPRTSTFANTALENGSGALNIDGSRIGNSGATKKINPDKNSKGLYEGGFNNKCDVLKLNQGRFPANFGLICECEQEPCECVESELNNNASRFFYTAKASRKERNAGLDDLPEHNSIHGISSKNGLHVSAVFMPTKNNHPTVKPLKLTEYLAKLLLPPIENSRILIPFSGSGSEMIGASLAGWQDITGVELNAEYINIAEKRLTYWLDHKELT